MNKSRLPWDSIREEMCSMKYNDKKSLTDINKWLFFKFGKHVTNARLSQLFTAWREEDEATRNENDPGGFMYRLNGDNTNAN